MYKPDNNNYRVQNKPNSTSDIPLNAKSMFLDEVNGVFRPFTSTQEAQDWFDDAEALYNDKFKDPSFDVIVNTGGTIIQSGDDKGKILDGVNDIYWFKDYEILSLKVDDIDLSNYFTKVEINNIVSGINDDISDLQENINDTQDDIDNHIDRTDNPHSVTKTQIGLGNVDDTSDEDKPISIDQIAALANKANQSDLTAEINRATNAEGLLDEKIDKSLFGLTTQHIAVGGSVRIQIDELAGKIPLIAWRNQNSYPSAADYVATSSAFGFDFLTNEIIFGSNLFAGDKVTVAFVSLTTSDIIPDSIFMRSEYLSAVKPVIDFFTESYNELDNSKMINGFYQNTGSYSPNDNRITTERIPVDINSPYIASGLGVLSTSVSRFHFWGVGNSFLDYELSNGTDSQVIQPADFPVGTISVSIQIANETAIGLDPTNSPYKKTAVFEKGTVAHDWVGYGLFLGVNHIDYDIVGKDEKTNERIDAFSYASKNITNMKTDAVARTIAAGTGALGTINSNRLGVVRKLVTNDMIGKTYTVSGWGNVPSTFAMISIRDINGIVIFEILGQGSSIPKSLSFVMPVGAYDIGFTIASEVGIGVTPFNNRYTSKFQFEEGAIATYPTIKGEPYVDGKRVVGIDTSNNPPCFVSYNPTGSSTGRLLLTIYVQRAGPKSNIYTGYIVENEYDMSELVYKNLSRIVRANDYEYDGGIMILLSSDTIFGGESECVYQDLRGSKADFTGGVHGDETFLIFRFFINGVIQDPATPLNLVPCQYAHYTQLSRMHETATVIGGVPTPNPAHPINNLHWKKTVFINGKYITENDLFWYVSFLIFWYHGISCIGKFSALWAYDEDFDLQQMTSTNIQYFNKVGQHTIEYYQPANKRSVTVKATLTSPTVADEDCVIFVDDRNSDSKFYRKTPVYTTTINQRDKSIMEVSFN